jgi:hypothetical protein
LSPGTALQPFRKSQAEQDCVSTVSSAQNSSAPLLRQGKVSGSADELEFHALIG